MSEKSDEGAQEADKWLDTQYTPLGAFRAQTVALLKAYAVHEVDAAIKWWAEEVCDMHDDMAKLEAENTYLRAALPRWISVATLPEFNGPIYFFVRGVGIKTGWYDAMHKSPWWNLDQSRDSISAQRYETEQIAGWCKRQFPEWPAPGTFAPSDAEKAT